jgi:hypothetical protein
LRERNIYNKQVERERKKRKKKKEKEERERERERERENSENNKNKKKYGISFYKQYFCYYIIVIALIFDFKFHMKK